MLPPGHTLLKRGSRAPRPGKITEGDPRSVLVAESMGTRLNAVIIGASSVIGAAIAAKIASTGAALCLVGRNAERLDAAAQTAGRSARSVQTVQADLTEDSAVRDLADRIESGFGPLDVLVHCAGAFTRGRIDATPVEALDRLYRANVRMPFALTQALLPALKAQRGQIVFINSSQGLTAKAMTGPYAATQHALKALADSLRHEVNADGVRVLSVYLGRTATPRIRSLFEAEGRSYAPELLLQAEDVAEVVMTSLQMPRTAEITNIEVRPLIKSY
jgi:NADP-dependent 3-hydroxy acid dehydrogenase YdfG